MIPVRPAIAAAAALAVLSGCGGAPDQPAAPAADEAQVLSDAAEMLPPEASETPTGTASAAAE